MNRRFIGNATSTPRIDSTTMSATICHQGMISFWTHMYAARPATSGEVMYPAEVAIDCTQLFSRIVMSRVPSFESVRWMAKARMTEVRPTPSVQPVLAPT